MFAIHVTYPEICPDEVKNAKIFVVEKYEEILPLIHKQIYEQTRNDPPFHYFEEDYLELKSSWLDLQKLIENWNSMTDLEFFVQEVKLETERMETLNFSEVFPPPEEDNL